MPTEEQMLTSIARGLPERTGRSLDQWLELIRQAGLTDEKAIRRWLKTEHGLGQNTQFAIAHYAARAAGVAEPTADELLDRQYAGAKAGLRPVYETVVTAARELGPDVLVQPRASYVSLDRRRQFAVVVASTRSRVDLALALRDLPVGGRLQPAGSVGSGNTSYRVALSAPSDVDDEVAGWLRAAYERAG